MPRTYSKLEEDLVGCHVVFAGYLRMLDSGAFHVTALQLGLDPALALKGTRNGLR